jgi:hypothetical protein
MRMTKMRDRDLDDLLALAAANRPAPDPALLERVLADALAAQAPAPAPRPVPARAPGLLHRLALALGGGAVLAGVTSTLFLGLVLGYLNPATLDYLTGGTEEAINMFPEPELLAIEG